MSESKSEKKEEAPIKYNILKPSLADAIAALEPFRDRIEIKTIIEQFEALKNNNQDDPSMQLETKSSGPRTNLVELLRIELRKLVIATDSEVFDEAIHTALLALAYYQPINSENLSMEPFHPATSVAVSTGQQFDLVELRNFHIKRKLKEGEQDINKELMNPINGDFFSDDDTRHIVRLGIRVGIFFRGLKPLKSITQSTRVIKKVLGETKLDVTLTLAKIKEELEKHEESLDAHAIDLFRAKYLNDFSTVLIALQEINQLNQRNLDSLISKFCYARVGLTEAAFHLMKVNEKSMQFEKLLDIVKTEFSSQQSDYFNCLNDMLHFLLPRLMLNNENFEYLIQLEPHSLRCLSKFVFKIEQFLYGMGPLTFKNLKEQQSNWHLLEIVCDSVIGGGNFTNGQFAALLLITQWMESEENLFIYYLQEQSPRYLTPAQIISYMRSWDSVLKNIKAMNLELSDLEYRNFTMRCIADGAFEAFEKLLNAMQKSKVNLTVTQLNALILLPNARLNSLIYFINKIQDAGFLLNEKEFEVLFDYEGAWLEQLVSNLPKFLKPCVGILAAFKAFHLPTDIVPIKFLIKHMIWAPKIINVFEFMRQKNIPMSKDIFTCLALSIDVQLNWKELEKLLKFFVAANIQINEAQFYSIIKSAEFLENVLELLGFFRVLQINPSQEQISMLIAKANRWNEPPTCQLLQDLIEFKPVMQSSSYSTSGVKEEQKAVLEYSGRLLSPTKRKPEEHPEDPRKEGSSIKDPKTSSS